MLLYHQTDIRGLFGMFKDYKIKPSSKTNINSLATECLILTINSLQKVDLNKISLKYINQIIQQENLNKDNSLNKSILLFQVPAIKAKRLLIISTGNSNELSTNQFLEMIKIISNKNIFTGLVRFGVKFYAPAFLLLRPFRVAQSLLFFCGRQN